MLLYTCFFQWIYWPYTCTSRTDIDTCCFKMFAFQFQKVSETVRFLDSVPSKFWQSKKYDSSPFSKLFTYVSNLQIKWVWICQLWFHTVFLTQDTWRCRSFNPRVYGFIQRKWGNTNAGNEGKHNMPRKEKRHVGKKTPSLQHCKQTKQEHMDPGRNQDWIRLNN